MPPSGFIETETKDLASFVRSLLGRFEEEVSSGKHENFETGVASELATIDRYLSNPSLGSAQKGVLHLCRGCYEQLQAGDSAQEIVQQISALSNFDFS